jgi:hypothetical protein
MISEQQAPQRLGWRGLVMSIPWMLALVIMLAILGGGRGEGTGGASFTAPLSAPAERALPARLAAIDEALARRDLSRAVFEWREAYGVALRSRKWDAMASVGDAAVRIDALARQPSDYPTGFRAEARQAYLRALVDARAARSRDGIVRVADAFAALGDAEMAARLHTLAAAR